MKLQINTIHIDKRFKGLLMGKPKPERIENEFNTMKEILGEDPIHDKSEATSYPIDGYVSWGYIVGVNLTLEHEDYSSYTLSIVFNVKDYDGYLDGVAKLVSEIDYTKEENATYFDGMY